MAQKKLKKWYFYQEYKEISIVAIVIFALWFILNFGKVIMQWLFTKEGHLYVLFLMAAVVIYIATKIYYRILVIKYHGKHTDMIFFKK